MVGGAGGYIGVIHYAVVALSGMWAGVAGRGLLALPSYLLPVSRARAVCCCVPGLVGAILMPRVRAGVYPE